MYHLKNLLGTGYIEKSDKLYTLSKKGKQHVAQLSLSTGRVRKQPQVLNCLVAQNTSGEYLFVRWHRQPNSGLVSFPHGMMHYGESSAESVQRELAEKAALTGDISFVSTVFIRSFHEDEIDRHMLVRVFKVENFTPLEANISTETSEPFWASLEGLEPSEFIPGFYELAQKISTQEPLSDEITHTM